MGEFSNFSRDPFSTFPQDVPETKAELWEESEQGQELYIGIPNEQNNKENRIALVPSSVAILVAHGHRIVVEKGAGKLSHFSDHQYSEAGADIAKSKKEVFKADIILKVGPMDESELDLIHPNQLILHPLQLPTFSREVLDALMRKRVIGVAMEYFQDKDGSFPLVRIMSEMAGICAMTTAAQLLTNSAGGLGVLLGGVSGVPPAKVVILGAGVVGEFATRAALGLGAQVFVFDNNIYKLMRLKNNVGQSIFTSSLNPHYMRKVLADADVAIGAIHSQSGRSQVVVDEDTVQRMKDGSVIIDVSIDQGGCFATSEMTTHDDPVFEKHGVMHYCVPNISSNVARTASIAISNILTPLLIDAEEMSGAEEWIYSHRGLQHGVYVYKGCLTNHYLSKRFSKKYTELNLLLTSRL